MKGGCNLVPENGLAEMLMMNNSYKLVQKLFHNLYIIFSNSLMGFKVICQLEKKTPEGT